MKPKSSSITWLILILTLLVLSAFVPVLVAPTPTPRASARERIKTIKDNLIFQGNPMVTPRQVISETTQPESIRRKLTPLNYLPAANVPSNVTAIIGYSFDPGDASQPITEETLEQAQAIVRQAAAEGALWLDADTGITNYAAGFIHDPAISYYPLAQAIIEAAHQAGIKVFFYFSTTEIETPDFEAQTGLAIHELHPDWLQIDQSGRPMAFEPGQLNFFWLDEDTADARMNPLSPGFREAIFQRAEKVAELGADGLFFDVPYFFTTDNRWADFSQDSTKAFKAATGYDLPKNLDADGKSYYVWLDWRHQAWADFFADLRQRVRAINPETQIIVEEYPGANPEGAVEAGLDPAIVDSGVDIATHEYDHKQDEGGAIAYTRADWQHTRDVYKWYQGMNRINWSLCYATTAADSRALAAITYAHQQSFWETRAPTMLDESTGPTWRKELLAWVAEHAPTLNGAAPVAEVAVLYSNRTRNLTYAANIEALTQMQHALDQAGLPYVILTEPNIGRIHDFPYLVLPGVTYATEAVLAETQKYTGTLLLTGDSLTRDGWDEADLEPPAESLSVEEAIARITTTPIQIEGGNGLFVELFRQGNGMQVRLFNPNLNADFEAKSRPITLRFKWPGPLPIVSRLDFMADSLVTLSPAQNGDAVEVQTEIGLMTVITIAPASNPEPERGRETIYPAWAYAMKIWPFDILYPGDSEASIRERLDTAVSTGANTVIFYIEEEQMYGSFVDEAGFSQVLTQITYLIEQAHQRNLKAVGYLNGLEVLTRNARTNSSLPSLGRTYPDWLQQDINGEAMVFYAEQEQDWIPKDAEDAWASPYSGWRDLFKRRLEALGGAGLDGVYLDATSLPGTDVFGEFWASRDPAFAAAFKAKYGVDVPTTVDWDSANWRKFIYFRHEAVRDYLGDLANTAREHNMAPFFEMSALDNETGTALGNDNQFTISGGIAVSPEVEPQYLAGGFLEAFRGAKASRDANPNFPLWFLGWPETATHARQEFAITLALSGNYYPTSDAPYPANAFAFIDSLRAPILDKRQPYFNTALLYPMRSKDFTYHTGSALASYASAFTTLAQKHIPFRILPQDTMTGTDLANLPTVVLAGAESMTDAEYALLQGKTVALVGQNGTKDMWFQPQSRSFTNTVSMSSLMPGLPFTITAPTTTYLEYYTDRDNPNHFFLFAYNNTKSGQIVISKSTLLTAKIYTLDQPVSQKSGQSITISISDYLHVIDLIP